MYIHYDEPNGQPRYTYVHKDGKNITSMAVFCMAPEFEGKPVFQLGYATAEHLRGQGRAKGISQAAIAELSNGLSQHGVKSFYLELVVGEGNIASKKVAEAITYVTPVEIIDENSGEPALQYMALISV